MATAADASTGEVCMLRATSSKCAGVIGRARPASEHQVVGGAFAFLQKFAPGHPGQRIPPVQARGRRGEQMRGHVAAAHVGQLVEQNHAAALLGPLARHRRASKMAGRSKPQAMGMLPSSASRTATCREMPSCRSSCPASPSSGQGWAHCRRRRSRAQASSSCAKWPQRRCTTPALARDADREAGMSNAPAALQRSEARHWMSLGSPPWRWFRRGLRYRARASQKTGLAAPALRRRTMAAPAPPRPRRSTPDDATRQTGRAATMPQPCCAQHCRAFERHTAQKSQTILPRSFALPLSLFDHFRHTVQLLAREAVSRKHPAAPPRFVRANR